MLKTEQILTAFNNEDLVFSLETGELLKISERITRLLDDQIFTGFDSLVEYEAILARFSIGERLHERLKLIDSNDFFLESTLQVGGVIYTLNELIWLDREDMTLHIFVFVVSDDNSFDLPESSMIEIVDKMPNPSLLISGDFSEVLIANIPMIKLLNQPVSGLVRGFHLGDFFADHELFQKLLQWALEPGGNRLSFQAKLYLKNPEGNWFDITLFKAKVDDKDCILILLLSADKSKRDQLNLERSNSLLSNIVEVQKLFLAQEYEAKPYQLLLTNILGVIEAEIGFIGEVAFDLNNKQVLKIHAATDISTAGPEAFKLYDKYVKNDFLFRHFDNLFGACITESKVILENNPPQNPHTKGIKIPGHPHIDNFLGIPILKGDKVVGLIGLGNKKGGFCESDIQELEPFASTYSVIIEAFNYETEKIKYEKESLEKALILSKVADFSPDLIVVANEDFEIEYLSKSSEKFFEIGVDTSTIHRKIRALLKKTLVEKNRVSKDLFKSRLKIRSNSGNSIWLESMMSLMQDSHSPKLIAVIRDVSVQARTEENLKLSLKKEREFNSFVSDFMNTVSHEFKTPLATIMSSLELSKHYLDNIEEQTSLERVKYHCGKIQSEINNLHQIVSHSLDFNRFAIQGTALKEVQVNYRKFIEACVNKYGLKSSIEYLPEVDQSLEVNIDKFMIETSLVNIMTNAIKYGGERKPELRLFKEGKWFGFTVTDHGIGIKKEELSYIFTPFFRGSNVKGIEGTGFGLVAVKNFIEIHGGNIKFKSEYGVGTTVEVRLPI
ncbi:His Kinase A (phospho-acceptor) domain-containing protein [Algoriphagus locisalis]|uniref:histidine kinase n=1 Tax=Algoriphagus locisalis TaxID=305507 RepID=A0A1I7BAX6_9BACT|nr:GAF domain-containing sensor histidine kinase [Algoriphagus locisalis]SFT84288.1 His Kinase A (phospho-acceptor) domain-containing protein [Algoriphagus locisalis]